MKRITDSQIKAIEKIYHTIKDSYCIDDSIHKANIEPVDDDHILFWYRYEHLYWPIFITPRGGLKRYHRCKINNKVYKVTGIRAMEPNCE